MFCCRSLYLKGEISVFIYTMYVFDDEQCRNCFACNLFWMNLTTLSVDIKQFKLCGNIDMS